MDFRQLQTLVTVADAESFARAAEQLFITPAAVSQQIRALENELGMQLFDRALRPPRLNASAEVLVGRARELVELFRDFKALAGESQVRGRLSIGSINGITVTLLPETLSSLTRRFPELRIRIEEGSSQLLARRVKLGELDAAIVSDITDLPATMERLPVFSEPLAVIASPECKASTWREALYFAPFLRLNRSSGLGALIDSSLKRDGVRIKAGMELDSSDSIVQMTLAGLGCGIVPMGRISADAARNLRILPFGEPQVHRQVVLVQRRNSMTTELTRLLYQELQSRIAERN